MVQSGLRELHETREQTLALAAGLSQAQLDASPGLGRWSVGELLDHILAGDRLFQAELGQLIELKRMGRQPYLDRNIADFPLQLGFLPKSLLPLVSAPVSLFTAFVPTSLVELLIRYPVLPAQSPPVLRPQARRPAERLRAELRESLSRTQALFDDNRDIDFHELLYQHPLLGLVDAPRMLRNAVIHEQRHQAQIRTALNKLGIAAPSISQHAG